MPERAKKSDIVRRLATRMNTDETTAAAWLDALIEPAETRAWLALGLEMAACNPDVPPFKTGVLQV